MHLIQTTPSVFSLPDQSVITNSINKHHRLSSLNPIHPEIMADAVIEDSELETLVGFEDEDLVICDNDYLLDNNRWFHTPNKPNESNAVDCKTVVLVSSVSVFNGIIMYEKLKRVKISSIQVSQLKRFEHVKCLQHLEISTLCADKRVYSDNQGDPIKLHALKRLHISKFDDALVAKVQLFMLKFDTPALQAVYLGEKRDVRFMSHSLI